jgi:crotonobetainyl-CoA:carnitine CoA-transferase CaiB-like acyl-CoA transferase
MGPHMAGMIATGREPPPMPARQGAWAVYETFDTADANQLFIGVTSDQQWNRFTDEFVLTELAADPRLATNELRIEERAWLIPKLKRIIATYSKTDIEARCERAKVSWAPVGKPADLFVDQHLLESGGLLDVFISRAGGETGTLAGLPAMPFELGDDHERPALRSQPPTMGEHNDEILRAAGFDADAIRDLAQRNIIVSA